MHLVVSKGAVVGGVIHHFYQMDIELYNYRTQLLFLALVNQSINQSSSSILSVYVYVSAQKDQRACVSDHGNIKTNPNIT